MGRAGSALVLFAAAMGTDKRARQKELHKSRLEAARKAEASTARRRRVFQIGGTVLAVAIVVAAVALFSGNKNDNASSSTTTAGNATTTTAAAGTPTTAPGADLKAATLTGPGPGVELKGETPCPKADGSSPRTTGFEKAPGNCIDESKRYVAVFDTTKGTLEVDLDAKKAPKTVNNFVVLARYKFYDGSPFFRLVKDFAAQFGDPSTSPSNKAQFGYTIPDEFPQQGEYKVGSIAMANTGQPNSGGAQVFFVTGASGAGLPPKYSLFGQVTDKTLPVLQAINAVPSVATSDNDGAPTEQITIKSITIKES